MRIHRFLTAAALTLTAAGYAEVPELTALVPEATGYELIARCDPRAWAKAGYQTDNTETLAGDLKRVGYLLKLTDQEGNLSWVFAAMDPFTDTIADIAVPASGGNAFQDYVNNLEVFSNVPGVKTGKFEKGNIEFWATNYVAANAKQIPGASDKTFDFGDRKSADGSYGSMQLHNYPEKQTVFSFSNLRAGANCDLGIGNNPSGNPDWTFSKSGNKYKSAELFVVAQIDNMKTVTPFRYDEKTVMEKAASLVPETTGKKLLYAYNLRTGSGFGDKSRVNYQVDNSAQFTAKPARVGYLMLLTDKNGKESWVYAEMDNFAENVRQLGVPVKSAGAKFQQPVANLAVKSNVDSVKTGSFPAGNIEFWPNDYKPQNNTGVEGASDDQFDFGDQVNPGGGYGSMQVHNTAEKQTVFAYNNFSAGANSDAGIGNRPGRHPDWTFSQNLKNYKSGWLFVIAD